MKVLLPYVHGLCNPQSTILNLEIPEHFDMYQVLKSGTILYWEPEVLACLLSLFNTAEEAHFLDIGANVGFYSLAITSMFKGAKATAVEPTPSLIQYINKAIKEHDVNINIINKAISSTPGKHKFYLSYGNSGSSLKQFDANSTIEVEAVPLDEIYKSNKFNIIKMDTEGTEYDVITSGISSIRKHRPWIVLEALNKNDAAGIIDLLQDYHLYHLKKDFTLAKYDDFIDPIQHHEWNYLLSPCELSSEFYAAYAKWADAIKQSASFISKLVYDDKIKKTQLLNLWKYIEYKLTSYTDFIKFPLAERIWYAFYHKQLPNLIHYEFIVIDKCMQISLHIETKNKEINSTIAAHIVSLMQSSGSWSGIPYKFDVKVNSNGSQWLYYSLPFSTEFEIADVYVSLMKKLVNNTINEVISKYVSLKEQPA